MVTIVASLTTATAGPGRAWSATEDDLALAERIETINDRDVSSCAALDDVQVAVPCVDVIVSRACNDPVDAARAAACERASGDVNVTGRERIAAVEAIRAGSIHQHGRAEMRDQDVVAGSSEQAFTPKELAARPVRADRSPVE